MNEQDVAFGIGANHLQILVRRAVDTVVTWTTRAFGRVARVRIAIRTRLTVDHLAVGPTTAMEVVAFDTAGEAVTFGDADDIDVIAFGETVDAYDGTNLKALDAFAELADVFLRLDAGNFIVSGEGAADA